MRSMELDGPGTYSLLPENGVGRRKMRHFDNLKSVERTMGDGDHPNVDLKGELVVSMDQAEPDRNQRVV